MLEHLFIFFIHAVEPSQNPVEPSQEPKGITRQRLGKDIVKKGAQTNFSALGKHVANLATQGGRADAIRYPDSTPGDAQGTAKAKLHELTYRSQMHRSKAFLTYAISLCHKKTAVS